MNRGEYLLEVRTEEIPARMLRPANRELASSLFAALEKLGIGPGEVDTGFTPRRQKKSPRSPPAVRRKPTGFTSSMKRTTKPMPSRK